MCNQKKKIMLRRIISLPIVFLLFCCSNMVFAQNNSSQFERWGGEISAGLGIAELWGENFGIAGNMFNVSTLLNYYILENVRIQTGIGVSKFANGALNDKSYSNVNSTFLEIPLKVRYSSKLWSSTSSASKGVIGMGFQANKSVRYELKTEGAVSKSNKGDWHFGIPLEIGVEFPMNSQNSFGIYIGGVYDVNSHKNYVLKGQDMIKLSFIYEF